jgi:hypothetical protein
LRREFIETENLRKITPFIFDLPRLDLHGAVKVEFSKFHAACSVNFQIVPPLTGLAEAFKRLEDYRSGTSTVL